MSLSMTLYTDFYLVTNFKLIFTFQFSTPVAAADRRDSTGSETHVFLLIDSVTSIPVGTVFAIASNLLLSANHNRLDPDTNLPLEMSFAKILRKKDGVIVPPDDKVGLKVLAFDTKEDWVIFERTDSERFLDTAVLCEEHDLPDENNKHNVDITIRYYNAGLFKNRLKQVHRKAQFFYYQDCDDVKATADVEDEAEIFVSEGAVRGVCGAPYYYQDKVVAFHVESDSEAMLFDRKNDMCDMIESVISTHSHFSVGRVLCRLPAFMELYRRNFKMESVETLTKATRKAVKKPTTATKKGATMLPKRKKIQEATPGVAAKKQKLGSRT